jgi:Acetoacetate decarboxylase (ADC)
MAAWRSAIWASLAVLAILGCAAAVDSQADPVPGAGFYDAAQLDDPSVGRCDWLGRSSPFVFQESDYIRGYFEPTNLAAYRQSLPKPFAMPARPLIRVSFLDFYEMAEGPTYRETEVAVLGMDGAQPGWVVLTLPVTNGPACIGGRSLFGLAKVMRKITLERSAERYVGTQYLQGGEKPEIVLTVDIGEPGTGVRELLQQYGSYPQFGLLQGRVLKFGGSGTSYAELAARGDYQVKLGKARLVHATASDSLLQRLGVGEALAAHWSRIRVRYTIKPR